MTPPSKGRAIWVALLSAWACAPAVPAATRELVHLTGTPYARGLQHGQALQSKVRSLYTTLLSSSILPKLGREQPDLAQAFPEYRKDLYANGQFGYQVLLDSAKSLEHSIPRPYRDEMRGIADGAQVPYEQVLVMNTFLDTVLALRAVAQVAHEAGAPRVERVVIPGLDQDGLDNDGDGVVDNPGEADFPYQALLNAARVELPPQARFVLTLVAPAGVDPTTVRLTLAGRLFAAGDPALTTRGFPGDPTRLEVTLTPPAPLPVGTVVLRIQAGDLSVVMAPLPAHARFMRDERLTFTIRGTGLPLWAVDNREPTTSIGHPPSFAFALRGAESSGGTPLLAHEFALLDANTAHNHTVLFVHHPDTGPEFAVVGWAGMVAGMSGMNAAGLALACDSSDTLNNSMVRGLIAQLGDFSNAKLVASGVPIGIFQRMVLEGDASASAAATRAHLTQHAFGWACLFADGAGGEQAVEVDSDPWQGEVAFGPGDANASGRALGSEGADDLRVASHYVRNQADMFPLTVQGVQLGPQSGWSTFFFRSIDSWALVGDVLRDRSGPLGSQEAIAILRKPELVDPTDSMNAVVYEPAARRLWAAMGSEPAPQADFEPFVFDGTGP